LTVFASQFVKFEPINCDEMAGLPSGALASELDTSLVVDGADEVDGGGEIR
jgi:hypothetical protein